MKERYEAPEIKDLTMQSFICQAEEISGPVKMDYLPGDEKE